MSNKNLSIDLHPRKDGEGKTFYVAKLQGPFSIDCSDGIVFLVFTSEVGSEQLQLASMDKRNRDD